MTRPLRVLQVFTVPQSLAFAAGQPAFMRERGIELAVCTSPGEGLGEFAQREGCVAYAVEMPRAITPFQDLQAVAELVAVIRRFKPDIVHASTPKGGLLGTIAARTAGVHGRIYHLRGLVLATATGRRRALLKATEKLACALATDVLCVSHSLKRTVVAEGIVAESRVEVPLAGSGQGVDATRRFAPHLADAARVQQLRDEWQLHGGPVVLFVGRLVGDKGIVELTSAWSQLSAAYPDARLVIVGPWEPRDPVPDDVRQTLEQHPTVRLVGASREVREWYALADVVVLPTYREGFPNVLLEAGAMRKPVVATRVDGCVDAVEEDRSGILVEPRDAQALAHAIARYLSDPGLREAHGAAARERVETLFDRRAIWGAIADIYFRIASRRGDAAGRS